MEKRRRIIFVLAMFALSLLGLEGCKPETTEGNEGTKDGEPVKGDWVRIYHAADPDGLHPFNARNAYATHIKEHVFMYLFDYHPQTMEHVPTLAVAAPEISADGLNYTYEIRPEARWDNGDPITGMDYEFSLKSVICPLTDNAQQRNYYSFIKDVKVDPSNDRRFTVFTETPFFLAESAISGIEVISRKHYDPDNLLGKFTVLDMHSRPQELVKDSMVAQFGRQFNSLENSDDITRVYGSGPYKVESWTSGDNVTLVRKDNWWGDQLLGKSWYFTSYPEKLIFKTIRDRKTVPQAAKNDELDVVRDMSPDDFTAAKEDTAGPLFKNFNFHTPNSYSTIYLGFNCKPPAGRNPIVADVAVRKAIAHITDIDGIIQNIYGGYGQRQVGPISPLHLDEYHTGIQPYAFDPELAKKELDAAGWVDSDGDGIRDKVLQGKKVDLKIEVLISNGSDTGPRMVRLIADQGKRIGMLIEPNPIDFGTLSERLRNHQFDMYGLGFSASPLPTDLKQVWHTENWANGGTNYFGFGNASTDSLIEQIRTTISPEERKPLYWKFQEIFHEQLPVLMIMAPQERIMIHKRFRNAKATSLRPGTKPMEFWVPAAEQKFK